MKHERQKALYLNLTALLIEREIAKFRRGEQTPRVSFHNVAILAGNAREELMTTARASGWQRSDPALAPTFVAAALEGRDDERAPCK